MLKWLKNGSGSSAKPPERAPAGPAQAAALRALGHEKLAQDDFAAAAGFYAQALALDPRDAASLLNLGFAELELNRPAQARVHLREAAALDAASHDACFFLGLACDQDGDLTAAASAFGDAAARMPSFEPAWQNLCRVLFGQGRPEEAHAALDQAAALHAGAAWPHLYRANLHGAAGRHAQAAASLREAAARAPGDAGLHHLLGGALARQGRLDEAVASFADAVRLDPANAEALGSLGNALRLQGELGAALDACRRAVALAPDLAGAHNNLGAVLVATGDAQAALSAFDRALALQPGDAQALGNRGAALAALGRHAQALESFDAALARAPDSAEVLDNRGNTLLALGRPEDALDSFDAALRAAPGTARALNHRGNALHALGRHDAALRSMRDALAADPSLAQAHNNIGNLLAELERLPEAVAAYDLALRADPGYAEAMANRGNALRNLGRWEEALAGYEQALARKPDLPYLYGNWLHARMQVCDWRGLDARFAELAARVAQGQVFNPFTMLATNLSRALQRECAQAYARARHPLRALPPATPRAPDGRIRLGYFSADFHEHATAWLMAELFELHDKDRFELVAFSFGPDVRGPMRARLVAAFDQFHVVNARSDREVALLAQSLGIDIAVDLKGYTQHARPGIFALRPAPVQVSYLGYPGTMGVDFIDYLIADETVVPRAHLDGYAEQVVWLPHSYQVNDAKRDISPRRFSRAELGLPDTGFVFCCFNANYKITPDVFDGWMRLLAQIGGSVLWLLEGNELSVRNLRAEAAARGIDPARLVFAPRMPLAEHLARHRLADLFLDTGFCNAHTTASDALWAGLPVLTRPGNTFASRVAASLVRAVGLPELAVDSAQAFEDEALRLARDAGALAALRSRLADRRTTEPLFDASRFRLHLEAAYQGMWDRHRAGLPPAHFSVPPVLPVPPAAAGIV